mgnify:CR=1 FL=1
MPSKRDRANDWTEQQAKRLEARIAIGKADKRWREMSGISQQNIHNLCSAAGVNFFNSQLAYWENGKLTPKTDFWYGREYINFAIAENDFPPTQGEFNRGVLDRFKNAEPFLNHEGEVATAADFFQMYGGTQPINKIYEAKMITEITEEHALNVSTFDRTVFSGFATDEMMSKKEAWDSLLKFLEKVMNKKTQRRLQAVCAGQDDWSVEEIAAFTNNGAKNQCAVADAFEKWTGKQMPEPLDIWTKGGNMKWPKLG